MSEQTTDQTNDQNNAITTDWYGDLAGDNEELGKQLGEFDSFDDFMADYNAAKNFDFRGALAGDDDKFKSQLERYADPAAIGNAFREAQQKIRSGTLKPELADDATEEQITEFRRNNNIPLEAEGYLKDLPDGLVVGEDDKELMLDFMGALHGVNADPKIAHAAIEWYNDFEEKQQEAIAELDAEQAREATDALRDAEDGWGKDYRANMNLIQGLLNTYMGDEATQQLLNGRYQDGTGFFNDVNVLKGLANLARRINDVAPLIQQDPDALKSLHEEIEEIEKLMGNRNSEYYKGPGAEKMQARYRELVELRSKSEQKSDAA